MNPPSPHALRRLNCCHCGFAIDVPIDCGDRFCSACAPRRAFRVRNRLRWILDNTRPKPGYMLKMITLSVSNSKDLEYGVKMLISSFRRLRQLRIWRDHVEGGATIIEIKGRPNNWHPHLHVLCYARWIDWHKLQPAWSAVSGGLACYIQNIDGDRALRYVTKYITKADIPPFLLDGVGSVLRKYRLFQRFGSWHSLRIPKNLYDYPCPNCTKVDWISEPSFGLRRRSRSPPACHQRDVPHLNDTDLSWVPPRIWPVAE